MCGLAGIVSSSGIDPQLLPRMGDAIAHRGPDGQGYLTHRPGTGIEVGRSVNGGGRESPTVGFAHRRLAIIDLSEASDQPALDESGRLALVFNGEIYNYVELRAELESLGHTFRTSGDTEVLLRSYAEWGPDCLRRLVGMWAFAMLDLERRQLFLARDRFGIKPLFYARAGDALYFASEIKSLLQVPAIRREPDEATMRRYLLTGAVDDRPETFFEGVSQLPAAHCLSVSLDPNSRPREPERYWTIPDEEYGGGREEAANEFADRFADAIRSHSRSDVPVGTCLSGGLDSSSIVCVADRLRRAGEIPRYAHSGFGYLPDNPDYSERDHMTTVVERTGIEMTYVEVTPERFAEALMQIARQQDEPFGSTSIAAQWFVFRAARQAGLKVMLDGQGADEVLGGYHHYFPLIAAALVRARRPISYARFARAHRREFGSSPLPIRHALGGLLPGRAREAAATAAPPPPSAGVLASSFRDNGAGPDRFEFDSINDLLAEFTMRSGLPSLLRFEDRNSMAHSIEARVPFLDHRLVEFAFSLPGDYKVDGVRTKAVLREAMAGMLPESIRSRRDKIGFRAEPSATWALAERHRDALLAERTPWEERWFDRDGLRALLSGSDRSGDAEFLLWRVINAKLWLRSFWGDADHGLG